MRANYSTLALVVVTLIVIALCTQIIPSSCTTLTPHLRFPGEHEPVQSIWMAYPNFNFKQGHAIIETQANMINTMFKFNPDSSQFFVDYLVHNESVLAVAKQQLSSEFGVNVSRMRFHMVPYVNIWLRDMGPIFLKDEQKQELSIVDFGFNVWSYLKPTDPESLVEEAVDRLIAQELDLPVRRSSLISEGGDREFNGRGTLFMSKVVQLQRNIDQGFDTLDQIAEEMKRVLNVNHIVWFDAGLPDDELSYYGKIPGTNLYTALATGGHLDEFIRFVDESTVLLIEVPEDEKDSDPLARITYDNMKKNLDILQRATDQDGKPFNIVRVPAVPSIEVEMDSNDFVFNELAAMDMRDGSTIDISRPVTVVSAASYLNFIIANKVVLIPKYYKEGRSLLHKEKDEQALKIFQTVFPGRTIAQIDTDSINFGGGGMHCITQQMPSVKSIHKISHDEL